MPSPDTTLLFLQLPQLDNDVSVAPENVPLAAHYLAYSLSRTPMAARTQCRVAPPNTDTMDDRTLVNWIVRQQPDLLVGTLYLWNIERFLHIAGQVRRKRPRTTIMVGGPEVARNHPFLFESDAIDAAASGEGEIVFPLMVDAWQHHRTTSCNTVAWRRGHRWVWGHTPPPPVHLPDILPPANGRLNRPDSNGMAYLETTRGCPLRCTFCSYAHQRRSRSAIGPEAVIQRIRILHQRGAREIRFIDPTFNSNPHFDAILDAILQFNRTKSVRFFAEIRADTITTRQAHLLKKANFTDLEVGVQSRSPRVLRAIQRPSRIQPLLTGIRRMVRQHIHLTVDLMAGLPGQTPADIRADLEWAYRIPDTQVQFLHTLLIPGTRLREQRTSLKLQAADRPPYRVYATPLLSQDSLEQAEMFARTRGGNLPDSPARKLVAYRLPDRFPESVRFRPAPPPVPFPGHTNRRAILIRGKDLFSRRARIAQWISRAITQEPHILCQFVVCPEQEEPLDLFDGMIRQIRNHEPHWLDRLSTDPEHRLVARRVMVLLPEKFRPSRSWRRAVTDLLEASCY
ncbi:MAG: hypothetical protein A2340_05210 [Lentisphaerae bacterium RIFOXYB12_FULL_60_10]|nr:MAG: hypothetical protein A2340_05210 [Lentisphaerae bacterium RIFOXYB12_FULL_60_10]